MVQVHGGLGRTDRQAFIPIDEAPHLTRRAATPLARDYAIGARRDHYLRPIRAVARQPTAAAVRPRRFDLFPRPEPFAVIIITGRIDVPGCGSACRSPDRFTDTGKTEKRNSIDQIMDSEDVRDTGSLTDIGKERT